MADVTFSDWGGLWQRFIDDLSFYSTVATRYNFRTAIAPPTPAKPGGMAFLAQSTEVESLNVYRVGTFTALNTRPSINEICRSPGFSAPWVGSYPYNSQNPYPVLVQTAQQARQQVLAMPKLYGAALPAIARLTSSVTPAGTALYGMVTGLVSEVDAIFDAFFAVNHAGLPQVAVNPYPVGPSYGNVSPAPTSQAVQVVYLAQNTDVKINRAQDIFSVETMQFTNRGGGQ